MAIFLEACTKLTCFILQFIKRDLCEDGWGKGPEQNSNNEPKWFFVQLYEILVTAGDLENAQDDFSFILRKILKNGG